MSYLRMPSAPLSDASKMIISFWFRDPTKNPSLPPAVDWPQGFWTPETADQTMVPPNAQYLAHQIPAAYHDPTVPPYSGTDFQNCVFFFNSYGMPINAGIGGQIFGNLFLGPASVWIPTPPPLAINDMHVLMCFGNPALPYNYYEWHTDYPGVIDAVDVIPISEITGGIGWQPDAYPPPYPPHNTKIGDNGLFHVRNFKIGSPTQKPNMVPQSFIGVDSNGYLTVYLQTQQYGAYQGCSFMLDTMQTMYATATTLVIDEPHTYTQIGFPFPDGHWIEHPGYWNGYQFTYQDISNQIMAAQPESFLLGGYTSLFGSGPFCGDGGWHHVLLSFDIGGSVHVDQSADGQNPNVRTACKAWLAVDDRNYTNSNLQKGSFQVPGLYSPKLLGTESTNLIDWGPIVCYARNQMGLGPNDIVPGNAWLHSLTGNPKDGLLRFTANSDIVGVGNPALAYGAQIGDFNPLDWTGSVWPLYGHGIAPGPWLGSAQPPRPTVPDPTTFALPTMDFAGFSIPLQGFPISIPSGPPHLAHNTGCEMAELQIWIGKTLDTGVLINRRLFVDKDGKAVPPAQAAKVLGKPDVLLHGTGNWKHGFNTGTSGVDALGRVIQGGQFVPTANIEKYLPDPVIGA